MVNTYLPTPHVPSQPLTITARPMAVAILGVRRIKALEIRRPMAPRAMEALLLKPKGAIRPVRIRAAMGLRQTIATARRPNIIPAMATKVERAETSPEEGAEEEVEEVSEPHLTIRWREKRSPTCLVA